MPSQNKYSTLMSERSRAQNCSYWAQSWSVISDTAVQDNNNSPVASRKASSTSRVDMPRAYISIASRSNTSELPSKNPNSDERNGSPASHTCGTRTGISPSAVRIEPSK